MAAPPPLDAIASIIGPSTRVTRRIDIYEEDAETIFCENCGVIDGNVSVDGTRAERRTIDVALENIDGMLDNYPEGFWYDKILKVFRGLTWDGPTPSWADFDASNVLWTVNSPSQNLTGGTTPFSVRIHLAADDWTPAAQMNVAGKWNDVSSQWALQIHAAGALILFYSTTGTGFPAFTSTATLIDAAGVVNGQDLWIGFDLIANNGAGGKTAIFLYSTDGITYNELGDPVIDNSTGTTNLFNGASYLSVGGLAGSPGQSKFAGNIYFYGVYDGARTITEVDFTNLENNQAGITDINGTPWTFSNGISKIKGGIHQEQSWETQIGEFLIDRIDTDNFPHLTKVTGRDYTKKLMEAEFIYATAFPAGARMEDVIKTIALNGGITKYVLPFTGQVLGRDFTFEAQSTRWDAITEIATAYGYDVFFDMTGFLVLEVFQDPISAAIAYTFETGEYGNLAKFSKSVTDTRIYNQVVVRGEATDIVPVTAIAENHEPSSPTSIERLKRTKTFNYTSAFITTQAQADEVARNFLSIHALESFEVSLTSVVIPWLSALSIVEFLDPDPNLGDPTRYLLTSFTIPLKLGPMSATAKRITVVG